MGRFIMNQNKDLYKMIPRHPQYGRRGRRPPPGRRPWPYSLWVLLAMTTIGVALFGTFHIFRRFPLETLIFATVIAIAVAGVILYIGELYVIGWIVDFLSDLGMPKFKARAVPLDWEQVAELIVVNLRDNIANAAQCRTVEKQLKRLIDEHHCDFVLDFTYAGRISMNFRGVMLNLMKAARREAENLGKPDHPLELPRGDVFRVFDDRQHAIEEMSRHGGHGWVVLCCVPVGVRAVSELT